MKLKTKRAIGSLIINSVFAGLMYFSLEQNNLFTTIVLGGLICLSVVAAFFVLFSNKFQQQCIAAGRSLPAWLSHSFGAAFIFWFAIHGWPQVALILLFIELSEFYGFSILSNKNKTI